MSRSPRPPRDWPGLARERIGALIDNEHAVVWPEVDAKLADGAAELGPGTIDPHHLVNARNAMLGEGALTVEGQVTRGGSQIDVYQLGDTYRRRRAVADAAARKRLLHARYRGWAKGTKTGSSLTGTALEAVVHNSLRQAAPGAGYRLMNPDRGEFRSILGVDLPGLVDNGGFVMRFHRDTGAPEPSVVVIVEAKNLREWVYPSTIELYQLLAKAAYLQVQRPEALIVPVFVCRRAHYLTREMGAELGFYPIETRRQYIQTGRKDVELSEVRNELGYNLVPSIDANQYMIRHFQELIPAAATQLAEKWQRTALGCADVLMQLWRTTAYSARFQFLGQLAEVTRSLVDEDEQRVWRRTSEDIATNYVADEY